MRDGRRSLWRLGVCDVRSVRDVLFGWFLANQFGANQAMVAVETKLKQAIKSFV